MPDNTYDSFPRIEGDEGLSSVSLYREIQRSLSPEVFPPPHRVSTISSVTDWSRHTLTTIRRTESLQRTESLGRGYSNDLRWFRMSDAEYHSAGIIDDYAGAGPAQRHQSYWSGGIIDEYVLHEGGDVGCEEFGTIDRRKEVTSAPTITALPDLIATTTAIVRSETADGVREEDLEWDDCCDPKNPMNWIRSKKWANMAVLSWLSLVVPVGSMMLTPGAPEITKDLNISSPLLATFVISVYMFGVAFGTLIWAPLSEMYGRMPIYHFSNLLLVGFVLACGFAQTYQQLIAFRFLAGALGTACSAIGAASVTDMFPPAQRAMAWAGWTAGPLLGPFLGPVVGGYIVAGLSWRWLFWILAAVFGFNAVLCMAVMRETYAPVLLRRKTKQKGKLEDQEKRRPNSSVPPKPSLVPLIARPLRLICFSPVVATASLYTAILYGILYLLSTAIPFAFSTRYGFSTRQTGLVYIAPSIGLLFGLLTFAWLSNRTARYRASLQVPEGRIPIWATLSGTTITVAGLLLYGWAAEYQLHWAIPLVGLALFGFGLLPLTLGVQAYLLEAFPLYAASAMAANGICRSVMTGLLPLSGLTLYRDLGFGWGNTLLAGVAVVAAVIPLLCRIWGVRWRKRFRVDNI